jgi:electron transfer flavoprotein alpha subunit
LAEATERATADGGEVWVYVETDGGRAAEVSLELLGRARELADGLGAQVGAVVCGAGIVDLGPSLIAHGADSVYAADHPTLAAYLAQPYARVVVELVRAHRPQIVLYGATTTGRDLAPRVASALRTGLTADCTDLRIGDHRIRERTYRHLLWQVRPAFGGNIIATIVCPDHRPQMATVREGVMRMPDPDPSRSGEVRLVHIDRAAHGSATDSAPAGSPGTVFLRPEDFGVALVERHQQEKRVDLKGARVIVAGGAGVGSADGFELVRRLAETLGGVVGASRAAVDAGWVPREHQVGQTGTTVRPKLYIAAGISGSVQHRAGMDQAARILAINTDPGAPIFSVAHYGIVGDYARVIPMLIAAYKSKGGAAGAAGAGSGAAPAGGPASAGAAEGAAS